MSSLTFIELFLISIGVSMDAFAVAICKGLSFKESSKKKALIIAAYFGVFQALMPLTGYLLGVRFQDSISSIDHWIAFVLLGAIGINMIKEAREDDGSTCPSNGDDSLKFREMIVLALATSIDALAVGVTFAFLKVDIIPSITLMGITTFVFSFFGVKIGSVFGIKFKSKAEYFGGVVLIFMAFKILFDHLGIISF